ncbi:MAG: lipoate--protein ligase family protein [Microcystaceae cyanobacterium]
MEKWRLLPFLEASGSMQMAIDRWLLQQHQQGNQPPSLRFYRWFPVTLSLGYHQRQYPSQWQGLQWQNRPIDRVYRPTGGRAVLHQGDLTYMVVTSGLKGSRIQVYEQICQFLIEGWRSLGIELCYGQGGRGYIHNPNCFGTATAADLVDQWGNKRIGSAQLKRGSVILQHGSMVLTPNAELFTQVFNEPAPSPINLGADITLEIIIQTLTQAASLCFNADLQLQPFSTQEWEEIQQEVGK